MDSPASPVALRRWLWFLGWANALLLAAYAVLSYGLVPATADGALQGRMQAELAGALGLGRAAEAFLGGAWFAAERAFLLGYCLPAAGLTAVFVTLLAVLSRWRDGLTAAPDTLFRFAVAFAVIAALASPVLVPDFWLSLAWGRMVAGGINPYHADVTAEMLRGLPLEGVGIRMTYGPLWAAASGIIMALAAGHPVAGAMLFKAVIAASWIGTLWLIRALLAGQQPWQRSVGIALAGWLPVGILHGPADAHNGVVMMFLMMLWLYGLRRGRNVLPRLALGASVLVKYVTAPLFVLDLVHAYREGRLRRSLGGFAVTGVLMIATTAIFYRSPDFFGATLSMRTLHFWRPKDAVHALESWLVGVDLWLLPDLVHLVFPAVALLLIARLWRRPGPSTLAHAVLGVMAAVLFTAVGHVWPWFLMWVLAPAALVPGTALARWTVGVGLALPFPILFWPNFRTPTLLLYLFAVLWFVFARPWFPSSDGLEAGAAPAG